MVLRFPPAQNRKVSSRPDHDATTIIESRRVVATNETRTMTGEALRRIVVDANAIAKTAKKVIAVDHDRVPRRRAIDRHAIDPMRPALDRASVDRANESRRLDPVDDHHRANNPRHRPSTSEANADHDRGRITGIENESENNREREREGNK